MTFGPGRLMQAIATRIQAEGIPEIFQGFGAKLSEAGGNIVDSLGEERKCRQITQ